MKRNIMRKWVKALRSGRYKQTTGTLKGSKGYCCLGVLCNIYAREKKIKNYWNKVNSFGYITYITKETSCNDPNDKLLPPSVMKWSGMQSDDGDIKNYNSLAVLNDGGKTFKEIADIIENKYKKL